jgi:fluoride exporter
MMMKLAYLTIGVVIGTFARYFLSGFIYRFTGTDFPYGTLVINLIGCFLIGIFATLSDEKLILGPDMRVMLMAGFCGAFTTFSTFMLETGNLIKDGEWLRAFGNVFLSVIIGFILFRLGVLLGKLI